MSPTTNGRIDPRCERGKAKGTADPSARDAIDDALLEKVEIVVIGLGHTCAAASVRSS
jgi:hypothetical protein